MLPLRLHKVSPKKTSNQQFKTTVLVLGVIVAICLLSLCYFFIEGHQMLQLYILGDYIWMFIFYLLLPACRNQLRVYKFSIFLSIDVSDVLISTFELLKRHFISISSINEILFPNQLSLKIKNVILHIRGVYFYDSHLLILFYEL